MFDLDRLLKSDQLQVEMKQFILAVLKARQEKRTKFHCLVNYLFRHGRIQAIITTNVDGLERMEQKDIPDSLKQVHVWGSDGVRLSEEPSKLIRLHGVIDKLKCAGCQKLSARLVTAADLENQLTTFCKECNPIGSSGKTLWIPDITFCETDASEKSKRKVRKMDGARLALSASCALESYNEEDYRSAVSVDADPLFQSVFIVGSSLSNPKLKGDLIKIASTSVRVYIIDRDWSEHFTAFKNAVIVKADAEEFAERMFELLAMYVQPKGRWKIANRLPAHTRRHNRRLSHPHPSCMLYIEIELRLHHSSILFHHSSILFPPSSIQHLASLSLRTLHTSLLMRPKDCEIFM